MHLAPVSTLESTLIGLALLIWASLLFGGLIFGRTTADRNQRMPLWTRLGSSFTLVIISWMIYIISQGTQFSNLRFWIAVGMSLGFLGDIFMAQLTPVQPHVLYGMAAFGAGHIAYMISMGMTGSQIGAAVPAPGPLIFWWVVAVIGWYIVVFRGAKPTVLHYAALPYALLLASTAVFAHSLALRDGVFLLTALGAALFLLSDLILAGELFSELEFPLIGDVVWLTYGTGQMLIVLGSMILSFIMAASVA